MVFHRRAGGAICMSYQSSPLVTAGSRARTIHMALRNGRTQSPHPRAQVDVKFQPRGGDAMMNRRQILCATAAGAALFARIPDVRAATYDLLIKGGRVVDPSVGLDGVRDVAVAGGRIVAVEANITGDANETIDVRGKIVSPGLIDIHVHAGRSKEGPPMALQDGVTGWVDAGTGGADNIDQVAAIARGAPQIGRALINIG